MIIIILLLLIILLLVYIFKLKGEVKYISKQIKESKGCYSNIRTKAIDSDIEELALMINYLYDTSQEINIKYKNVEEELKKSIANMSHDLRTPLTSIMGYVQLIKSNTCSESEKTEYLDIVEKRTKNLQNLITSFYDLSRLNSNEFKFKFEKINLNTILCDTIASYYNEFIKRGIEPVVEIEENISNIISDPIAVNRVFSNLVGNMIKHGKGNIKINLKEKGNYIISTFSNYAPNISKDEVGKIFNRFYTTDKSRANQNTGLGLAITKGFIEELGHEIRAELVQEELIITILWNK